MYEIAKSLSVLCPDLFQSQEKPPWHPEQLGHLKSLLARQELDPSVEAKATFQGCRTWTSSSCCNCFGYPIHRHSTLYEPLLLRLNDSLKKHPSTLSSERDKDGDDARWRICGSSFGSEAPRSVCFAMVRPVLYTILPLTNAADPVYFENELEMAKPKVGDWRMPDSILSLKLR